jgi:hypothetical protein
MDGSGASIFTATLNMMQARSSETSVADWKIWNPDMETVAVDYRDTQSQKAENERYFLLIAIKSLTIQKIIWNDYTFIFYAWIEPKIVGVPKTFTITEQARCSQY